MQISTMRDHFSASIAAGLAHGQCARCVSSLSSFLAELACPHWFLVHGPRAFRLDKLAEIFQLYDTKSVIDYLRIVAEFSAGPAPELPPYSVVEINGQHEVTIR